MSFALLAPLGLAALAALALPILIHLVRRLQLERIEFAALRWIVVDAPPRRRIRFERPWLLLVRLLLLLALALLLARPVLEHVEVPVAERAYVVPGVAPAVARAALDRAGLDLRWLAPSFPGVEQALATDAVPLASLLREADAGLPEGAVLRVVVPRTLAGLDGERARLAHTLDWRVVDGAMDAAPTADRSPIRFAVRYADEEASSLPYLRAAVAAWNAREPGRYVLDAAPVARGVPSDAHWLAWLAPSRPAEVDAWIEHGGVALVTHDAQGDPFWRAADGRVLARSRTPGAGRVLALPLALAPEHLPMVLDAAFARLLRDALRGAPPAPDRADADAYEPIPAVGTAHADAPLPAGARRPLDGWFVLLAGLLFLVERALATHAPRQVAR
ncbi:MAG: BatA domain-containing protein [Dokdonella sp.]|uniref:BatA domain-containing protein n=1 Tax=Dokdonella sp. TaxID=2291710 RepID=UPI003F810881